MSPRAKKTPVKEEADESTKTASDKKQSKLGLESAKKQLVEASPAGSKKRKVVLLGSEKEAPSYFKAPGSSPAKVEV